MTYIVHRYGQDTAAQPLARVGQTAGVGMVRLMVGEVTCGVPDELRSGPHKARARARVVVACAVEAVTHLLRVRTIFPHLIATHLHLLTQLTCNSAAALSRHRTTVATPAHSTSYARTHRDALRCTLFFAYRFFFVATLYQRASVSLVGTTLTKSTQLMNTNDMNALEYAAYVRLCLFLLMGGCAIILACIGASIHSDYRKSNRK
jgi:hypothetical protein